MCIVPPNGPPCTAIYRAPQCKVQCCGSMWLTCQADLGCAFARNRTEKLQRNCRVQVENGIPETTFTVVCRIDPHDRDKMMDLEGHSLVPLFMSGQDCVHVDCCNDEWDT